MPNGSSHVSDVHAENSLQGDFFVLFPWRPYWCMLPIEKDFIELLGKRMLFRWSCWRIKSLKSKQQTQLNQTCNMQELRWGEWGGRKGIAIYIPLNWFNVNETQSRPENFILICTEVLLPLPEMFRKVMWLYCGVKIEVGLVKSG